MLLLLLFLLCAFVLGAGARTSYSSSYSLSFAFISIYCRAQLSFFFFFFLPVQPLHPTKTWTSSEFLPFRKKQTKPKQNTIDPLFLGCFITPRQFLLFSTIQENSVAAQEWPRTGAKIATVRYDNSDIAAASAYGKMTMVRALPIISPSVFIPSNPSNPIDIYLIKPVLFWRPCENWATARTRVCLTFFRCVCWSSPWTVRLAPPS